MKQKKYTYEVELDYPDYYVEIYSDKKLSGQEVQKKALETLTYKTTLYDVHLKDNDTGERTDVNKEVWEDLAPGI